MGILQDGQVIITDKDLQFVIDYKGADVGPKDRALAIGAMKEKILAGDNELLSYFSQNGNIPQFERVGVFNLYYSTFPVFKTWEHNYAWEFIQGLLLAEDKAGFIRARINGSENGDITPGIVQAQLKFAIAAIPTSCAVFDSKYMDLLANRYGERVAHMYLSDINKQDYGRLPSLGPEKVEALKTNKRLVVAGKDGKEYLLRCDEHGKVSVYKHTSSIPREGEEALLDRYLARIGISYVHELFKYATDLNYEQWHREKIWNAAIGAVNTGNMPVLSEILENSGKYPANWVQQAKDKLKALQESYMNKERKEGEIGDLSTLVNIHKSAQTAEIKQKVHEQMKAAYTAAIDKEIAEGKNIDHRCRMEHVPKDMIDSLGTPKLLSSYRAEIARICTDPKMYWKLERMADGENNWYPNTPETIRKEAREAQANLAKATVAGLWQEKNETNKPKNSEAATAVSDKQSTVDELGKGIAKQPPVHKKLIPRVYQSLKSRLTKH